GVGRTFPVARVTSLVILCAAAVALFHAGRAGYYLATDVQVAPFMLTPDSDAITGSRLSLAALTTERETAGAHLEVLVEQLQVARDSRERLTALHAKFAGAVGVSRELTAESERSAQQELQKVLSQRTVIEGALAEQASYIEDLDRRVESGLAHGSDVVRERAELRRLQLLQLDRERDQVAAENRARELGVTRASQRGATDRITADQLRLEEQLLRLELEVRGLEADERGKLAELASVNAQTARLDELIAQLKQRPLYRAIANKQTLAFVPYTQLRGVRAGASIYQCRVWSVFSCDYVGRIAEVLPGEIDGVDPWGTRERGEYAVLDLSESRAITAKTLRVRAQDRGLDWSFLKGIDDKAQTSSANTKVVKR
ncbi:MAG TPA: hypothetical protein VMF89_15005, partial [Polyangiales bacterium]|nr:hypothetical protein [Polyangiales bacterium]